MKKIIQQQQQRQDTNNKAHKMDAKKTPPIDYSKMDANEMLKITFVPKEPNKNYVNRWKQFRKWVDNAHGMGRTNNRHVTRDNVDKFFLIDQRVKTNMQTKNLTQMKDAIQFYADFYEHPPPEEKFVVNSRIVQECIDEHRRNHCANRLNLADSSHLNLHSDVLSK